MYQQNEGVRLILAALAPGRRAVARSSGEREPQGAAFAVLNRFAAAAASG